MSKDENDLTDEILEEKEKLWQQMNQVLTPRTPGGLIVPLECDDDQRVLIYPCFLPNKDGRIDPLVCANDFKNGIPENIIFELGVRSPYDPNTIVYLNPALNAMSSFAAIRQQLVNTTGKDVVDEESTNRAVALYNHTAAQIISHPFVAEQFPFPKLEVEKNSSRIGLTISLKQKGLQQLQSLVQNSDPSVFPRFGKLMTHDNNGKEIEISNFDIIIKCVKTFRKEGERDMTMVVMDVRCKNESRNIYVNVEELEQIANLIKKKFPSCNVNPNFGKSKLLLEKYVRDLQHIAKRIIVVRSTGWLVEGNRAQYVHDGVKAMYEIFPGVEFCTNLSIPVMKILSPVEAFKAATDFLQISRKPCLIYPLVFYTYLGVLYSIFEDAGYPPHVLLFLNGRTGSFKTAVATVLYNIFGEKKSIAATFRDTAAALEIKIGDHKDRILLVDDYQPAVTAQASRQQQTTLEFLVRLYGDGIGKSRSTATLERMKEFVPHGLCAITGEDTGGSESSLLRCLLVPISVGDIDGHRLKVYQEEPELWTTNIAYFLNWAGHNYQKIKSMITSDFVRLRDDFAKKVKSARQADYGAFLMLTAQIFNWYGCDIGALQNPYHSNEIARDIFEEVIKTSETLSSQMNPVKMYLTAINDLIISAQIHIATSIEKYEMRSNYYTGYEKDGKLWLDPHRGYKQVVDYWKGLEKRFPLSKEKTHAAFNDHELIVCQTERLNDGEKEKKNYLVRTSLNGRPRFLAIHIDRANRFMEQE